MITNQNEIKHNQSTSKPVTYVDPQSVGVVVSVRGQIVEVEFNHRKPNINDLLVLEDNPLVKLEVYSSSGINCFYCLSFSGVEAIFRGARVINTERQILFPVGQGILGRVVDIFGNPLDGAGPLGKIKELHNIVGRAKETSVSVFAGIGERSREGLELFESLKASGVMANSALIFGPMGENPAVRFLSAFSSTTLAEYFRDEEKKDVLFFIDNVYRFAQAGNELSTLTSNLPSEDGYQSTLESEMANFHERLLHTPNGAISTIEAIYVPADDLLDHGVQSIFPYLDSIVVLSRSLYQEGILPAIDILASTSNTLHPHIVGDVHYDIVIRAKAILKQAESLQRIVSLVGESELSGEDQLIYRRAKKIKNFLTQSFFVAERQKGKPGCYVELKVGLQDLNGIIEGKFDHIPEERFMFIGSASEIAI